MPQFSYVSADETAIPFAPVATDDETIKSSATDGTITSPTGPVVTDGSDTPESTPLSSPTSKQVNFPVSPSPVTSFSRPLTNPELWPLYHFEQHARSCRTCRDPYDVTKAGSALCKSGQKLGSKVTQVIYSKSDGLDIFAMADVLIDHGGLTRVELPRQYVQVRSLLRAVERVQKWRRHSEKTKVVDREDESKQRELSRRSSPDRSPRPHRHRRYTHDEPAHSRRHRREEDDSSPARPTPASRRESDQLPRYRLNSPIHMRIDSPRRRHAESPSPAAQDEEQHHHRRQRSPSHRPTPRSYHESDMHNTRRRSSSIVSRSSSTTPVEVVDWPRSQPPPPQQRPAPVPIQSRALPMRPAPTPYQQPPRVAAYPITTGPVLTHLAPSTPPYRRLSVSSPPAHSSFPPPGYKCTAPPSAWNPVPRAHTASVTSGSTGSTTMSSGSSRASWSGPQAISVMTSRGVASLDVRRPG